MDSLRPFALALSPSAAWSWKSRPANLCASGELRQMIVLDASVLSELLRPAPEPRVVDWLKDQPRTSLFTTTVTRGEILYGLWDAAIKTFDIDLAGQVLTFD